jgi:hypothetical protein
MEIRGVTEEVGVDKKRHAAIVYGWLFELEK